MFHHRTSPAYFFIYHITIVNAIAHRKEDPCYVEKKNLPVLHRS